MAKYSYNGVILPQLPAGMSGHLLIYTEGDHYLLFSRIEWISLGGVIGTVVDSSQAATYHLYGAYANDSQWTLTEIHQPAGGGKVLTISGSFVWTNKAIPAYELNEEGTGYVPTGGTAYNPSEPILVPEETRVLKAFANKYTTNTYGATGIYVGAQVLDTATGRVTDISNEATYSFDAFQSPYAYLDENRQLIISEDLPFNGVGVIVTWDELPGQKATVPVFLEIESGEPEGGGGGGYYPGGDDIIIDTSAVTDIIVSIIPMEVTPGGHAFFEVLVTGTGNYSGEYTLELNGQESPDTYFTKGSGVGNIWIAEDETADFVLLTATSVENPLIQTTEMLYIDQTAVVDPVATADQLQRSYMQGYATAKAYLGKLKIVEGTVLTVDQTDTEEAPDDIPSQLKRAFMQGFMSGVGSLAGKGKIDETNIEPEPVAYLYNGERLPALPEGKYPNAIITRNSDGVVILCFVPDGWYIKEFLNYVSVYVENVDLFFEYRLNGEEWTLTGDVYYSGITINTGKYMWSNFDIIYNGNTESTTVAIYGSEPIPVYE